MKIICLFLLMSIPRLYTVAQISWEHTDGPFGSIGSILHANDDYVFTPESDFIYRSPDGLQWGKKELDHASYMGVYQNLIICPYKDGNQIFLRTSIDNGENWEQKELSGEFRNIWTRFTVCEHGIYFPDFAKRILFKSNDLGKTWTSLPIPEKVSYLNSFENKLYLFGDSVLVCSENEGMDWINLTPDIPATETTIDDLMVRDSNLVFTTQNYVYYSHNYGQTWVPFNIISSFGYDKLALVGDQVYFKFGNFLLRTNDYGIHWDTLSNVTNRLGLISHTGFKNEYIVSTATKGIFKWDDGSNSLVEINTNLSKGFIFDMSLNTNKLWTACGNGLFYLNLENSAWSEKMNLPSSTEILQFQKHFVSTNELGWVVTEGSDLKHFYFSMDEGATWNAVYHDVFPFYDIHKVQLISDDIFLFTEQALYRSPDAGQSWNPIRHDKVSNDIIIFNEKYYMVCCDSVFISQDSGTSWNYFYTPFIVTGLSTYGDELFAYTLDPFYTLTNIYKSGNGIDWTAIDNGLVGIGLIINPTTFSSNPYFFKDSKYYYAFFAYSFYLSPIDTIEWSILPQHAGSEIIVANDLMYLGSEGLYRSALLEPDLTNIKELVSNNLFTITPNPAYQNVTITFTQDIMVDGIFQIFSANGLLVKSLEYHKENKKQEISLQDLPSGLYYISFKGEDVVNTQLFLITHY